MKLIHLGHSDGHESFHFSHVDCVDRILLGNQKKREMIMKTPKMVYIKGQRDHKISYEITQITVFFVKKLQNQNFQ